MDKDFRNICDSQTDTYVLCILGTGGDVITSRISLEYSGSNGRTIMGTSIRHQNIGHNICLDPQFQVMVYMHFTGDR